MNYFIEGIQGAGKSTLVGRLASHFPKYRVYREGDYNPVELAWCAYLSEAQYESVLAKYDSLRKEIIANTHTERDRRIVTYTRIITDVPGFHKDLEQYEIYNNRMDRAQFEETILKRYARWNGDNSIFECSLLQNIVENQVLFYEMTDEEIVAFLLDEEPWEESYTDPATIFYNNPQRIREYAEELRNCHKLFSLNPGYTEEYGQQIEAMIERIESHCDSH